MDQIPSGRSAEHAGGGVEGRNKDGCFSGYRLPILTTYSTHERNLARSCQKAVQDGKNTGFLKSTDTSKLIETL